MNCSTTNISQFQKLLESPEFLLSAARTIGLISVPMNVFYIFCIVFKTSKIRQEIKYCMLNLQLWTFFMDLEYTYLSNFYLFLPATAVASQGLLSTLLKIPTEYLYYLDSFSVGGLTIAIIMLFENRHYNIVPFTSSWRIKKPSHRIALAIFNFSIGSSYIIPSIIYRSDQNETKKELLKIYPCPNPIFFTDITFAMSTEANYYLGALTSAAGLILFIELLFFISHIFYWLYKVRDTTSSTSSNHAKQLQRKFFIATCIQVAVPMSAIVIPTWLMGYVLGTGNVNQALVNIATLMFPLHGIAATIVSVIANKSYRDFTISLLLCSKNEVVITNVSAVFKRSSH